MSEPLIFSYSKSGRRCSYLSPRKECKDINDMLPMKYLRREAPSLPEVSELDMVRHYTRLAHENFSIDTNFYPLGSCTMKYNPKINEQIASMAGFTDIHPLTPPELCQGILRILYDLSCFIREITGMDATTLVPAAGAQGEFTGLKIISAYFADKGETRTNVLVPDTSHGTNPASSSLNGLTPIEIPSNDRGMVDIEKLSSYINEETAALMLTNPNTLGLFERDILKISEMCHQMGVKLYYDGANLNAIMGISRPGDMGFDVCHVNLHKSFSTPHGGGGPGAGPVAVKKELAKFLPVPVISKDNNGFYFLDLNRPDSIGRIHLWQGNVLVLLRAYVYILSLGGEGLKQASQMAVLNANYLQEKLKKYFHLPFNQRCKHEFVLSGTNLHDLDGLSTSDLAKRLLDYGIHSPTIYFPHLVKDAIMIEPTETESLETLDNFVEIMIKILDEAKENPDLLHKAPHNRTIKRLDQTIAARKPVLKHNI